MDGAEELLEAAGWTRVGTDANGRSWWLDPAVEGRPRSERVPSVTLPTADGGEETVHQTRCPPASFRCSTEDALERQTSREAEPEAASATYKNKLGQTVVLRRGETVESAIAARREELAALERLQEAGHGDAVQVAGATAQR